MKKSATISAIVLFALMAFTAYSQADQPRDQKSAGLKKISGPTREINIDIDERAIEASVEEAMQLLEKDLEKLEVDLERLDIDLSKLANIEIPEINLESMEINIPEINIEPIEIDIPELHFQPVDVNIPEIEFDEEDFRPRKDSPEKKERAKGLKKLE